MLGVMEGSFASSAFSKAAAVELARRDEAAHVVTQLIDELSLAIATLYVGTVQPADDPAVEHRRPRFDRLEILAQPFEERGIEHTGVHRGLVGILGKDVPGAELQILDRGEGYELADQRRAVLGSLAEPDGAHLRERAVRLREPFADRLTARHERRPHRAEPDQHHAAPPAGRRNMDGRMPHDLPPRMVASSALRSSALSGGSRVSGSQR